MPQLAVMVPSHNLRPLVWPAALIVWGSGFVASRHRHHCVQLVATTDGSLRIRRGPGEGWKRCGAALVRPDAVHEIDARDAILLIGFIDAESEWGAALCEAIRTDISCIGATRLARWRKVWGPALDARRVEHWVLGLTPTHLELHKRMIHGVLPRAGTLADPALRSIHWRHGVRESRYVAAFQKAVSPSQ